MAQCSDSQCMVTVSVATEDDIRGSASTMLRSIQYDTIDDLHWKLTGKLPV